MEQGGRLLSPPGTAALPEIVWQAPGSRIFLVGMPVALHGSVNRCGTGNGNNGSRLFHPTRFRTPMRAEQAPEDATARLADHVADEEQSHRAYSIERVSRMTVTLIWPG